MYNNNNDKKYNFSVLLYMLFFFKQMKPAHLCDSSSAGSWSREQNLHLLQSDSGSEPEKTGSQPQHRCRRLEPVWRMRRSSPRWSPRCLLHRLHHAAPPGDWKGRAVSAHRGPPGQFGVLRGPPSDGFWREGDEPENRPAMELEWSSKKKGKMGKWDCGESGSGCQKSDRPGC